MSEDEAGQHPTPASIDRIISFSMLAERGSPACALRRGTPSP
jgi:hypothetical protein